MRENNYSVRYARVNRDGKLHSVSVWDKKGRTQKYTLDGARKAAEQLLETRPAAEIAYCKIYNGKELIETIER